MEKVIGTIKKEEFMDSEWYFLDVPFKGSVLIDEKKFTDVDKYVNQKIECELLDWDYTQKRFSDRYRVVGAVK